MASNTIPFPARKAEVKAEGISSATYAPSVAATARYKGMFLVPFSQQSKVTVLPTRELPSAPVDSLAHAKKIVAQVEREMAAKLDRERPVAGAPMPGPLPPMNVQQETPVVVARRLLNTLRMITRSA